MFDLSLYSRQPEEKPDVSDENGHGVGDGDDEPLEPYRKPVMMTISDLSKGRGRGRPKKDGFSKPINAKTSSKSTSTKASAAVSKPSYLINMILYLAVYFNWFNLFLRNKEQVLLEHWQLLIRKMSHTENLSL